MSDSIFPKSSELQRCLHSDTIFGVCVCVCVWMIVYLFVGDTVGELLALLTGRTAFQEDSVTIVMNSWNFHENIQFWNYASFEKSNLFLQ